MKIVVDDREQYVMMLRASGMTFREIGEKLGGLSATTARTIYNDAILAGRSLDKSDLSSFIFKNIPNKNLATRVRGALKRAHIRTIEDFIATPISSLEKIRNLGEDSMAQIKMLRRILGCEEEITSKGLTFEDIKDDIDIRVSQSEGKDDPMFTIIYGKRYLNDEDYNLKTVEVSIYKDTDGKTFIAKTIDDGKFLGENFNPTKGFFVDCFKDVLKLCKFMPISTCDE